MRFLHCEIHIGRLPSNWDLIGEAPSGQPRIRSPKRSSIYGHLLGRQLSHDRRRQHLLYEYIVFKNHFLAHSGRPELLEGLYCIAMKIVPARNGSNEFHESKATNEFWSAGGQMERQSSTPVLRDDVRGRDAEALKELFKVPSVIGKTIFNIRLSRLAESDKVRRDAMRDRCNQRNNIPPYVRRGRIPVQEKRHWCLRIAGFTLGPG